MNTIQACWDRERPLSSISRARTPGRTCRRLGNPRAVLYGQLLLSLTAISVLVLVALFTASVYCMEGFPVSYLQLSRVMPGMDGPAVKDLLGPPSEQRPGAWRYHHPAVWTMVTIRFDETPRVHEIEIDR